MPEVRCATHGVFNYKTVICPGCINEARQRYDQLVTERNDESAFTNQRKLFERDAARPPISAGALATLRTEDPGGAAVVAAELERERQEYEERQKEGHDICAAIAALSAAHGLKHRLGLPGSKYRGRLLGAVTVGSKRYARLRQGFLDGGDIICVPWIDAFANRIAQEIAVQWIDTSEDVTFRVSDRDGRVDVPLDALGEQPSS